MVSLRLKWSKVAQTEGHPEEKTMYAASTILTWFEEEFQMRQLVTVYAREAK